MDRSEWCGAEGADRRNDRLRPPPAAEHPRRVHDGCTGGCHRRSSAPPPAEQASGEHVETLRDMQGWRMPPGRGEAYNRALDAAIAALSQRPVVDEAMVRDLLPDGWTQDCQGKQDYDAGLVALSCRYYPPRYSENGSHSASAALVYGDGVREIAWKEFEAPTEGGVKVLVEEWAQQQVSALTAALAPQQQGGKTE